MGCALQKSFSDRNALYLIEADLVIAPIVEACCSSTFVVGHPLGDLELSAVTEILPDAGGPERPAWPGARHGRRTSKQRWIRGLRSKSRGRVAAEISVIA